MTLLYIYLFKFIIFLRSKIEKVDFKGKKFYLTVKGKEVVLFMLVKYR